jgi:hypothetical protein
MAWVIAEKEYTGRPRYSAEIQCSWCKRMGKFYFNLNEQDTLHFSNWRQTRSVDPEAIICDTCETRKSPPHAEYLTKLNKKHRKLFGATGMPVDKIAEFANKCYAQNSPERLAEAQRDPSFNNDFPPRRVQSAAEMERRENYGNKSISDCINFIYNWIVMHCPICDNDDELLWCTHKRPSLQVRGTRGVTISFNHISPGLRAIGLWKQCLHTGLRSMMEAAHDHWTKKGENMYLELDGNSAWQAAGYLDPNEPETEEFIHRRQEAQQRVPCRDIYYREPESATDEMAVKLLRTSFGRDLTFIDVSHKYVHRRDADSRQEYMMRFQSLCPNCGKPCSNVRQGNYLVTCQECNSNDMCINCTGRGQKRAVCYPCEFRYR